MPRFFPTGHIFAVVNTWRQPMEATVFQVAESRTSLPWPIIRLKADSLEETIMEVQLRYPECAVYRRNDLYGKRNEVSTHLMNHHRYERLDR